MPPKTKAEPRIPASLPHVAYGVTTDRIRFELPIGDLAGFLATRPEDTIMIATAGDPADPSVCDTWTQAPRGDLIILAIVPTTPKPFSIDDAAALLAGF